MNEPTESACPHIVTSDEGTSYCTLAEAAESRLREAETRLEEARAVLAFYADPESYIAMCGTVYDHGEPARAFLDQGST